MAKDKGVVTQIERRRLNWKDVTTIIVAVTVMSGMLMSIVGWIHAEVTIPKILNRTADQIDKAIDRHSKHPHPVSASKKDVIETREMIKEDIQEWKQETRARLDRIESKL